MGTLNDTAGTSGILNAASDTWTITGPNAGNLTNGAVSFTGMGTLNDTTGAAGVLQATGDTWTVTGANAGSLTNGALSFTGMGTLNDLGTGVLDATSDTWTVTGAKAGNLTTGALSFTGMGTLNDLGTGTLKATTDTWTVTAATRARSPRRARLHGDGEPDRPWRGHVQLERIGGRDHGHADQHRGLGDAGRCGELPAMKINSAGALDMGTAGTVGVKSTATLDYGGYGVAVTYKLGGLVEDGDHGGELRGDDDHGSGNSDTLSGTNATYSLTSANAGNSGGQSWTSFEKVADLGTGTISAANATYTVTGAKAGNVTTLLPGGFTNIGTLNDTGVGTLKATSDTWTVTGAKAGNLTNWRAQLHGHGHVE